MILKIFRILLIFSFIFVLKTHAQEEAIQAGVRYDEASARIEAFYNVQDKIDKEFYKDYLKDKYRDENLEFIKNNITDTKKGRLLCPFYLKNTLASYAVKYLDEQNYNYNYYYNILGNLVKFDIVVEGENYQKILGYSRYGNLLSVAFEVDDGEQFVYDDNGKLIAHWKDNKVLNKNNKMPKILQLRRGVKDN